MIEVDPGFCYLLFLDEADSFVGGFLVDVFEYCKLIQSKIRAHSIAHILIIRSIVIMKLSFQSKQHRSVLCEQKKKANVRYKRQFKRKIEQLKMGKGLWAFIDYFFDSSIIIAYVMEGQSNPVRSKIVESIQRSSDLLSQNKEYEYAQKIKSLAQRKLQTNKPQEAEWFLYLGSQKMLKQEKTEINAVNELITALIQLYQKEKSLITKETSHQLYHLLNLKPNPKKIEYYSQIIKLIGSIKQSPQIVEDYINIFENKNEFWKVEPLVVHTPFSRISSFLQKWKKCIDEDEFIIVSCRMAIMKGLYYDFDEPMVILAELPGHHPFVKYTKFLIQSVQMKSRECYQKIGTSYEAFLKTDAFFQQLYELYGVKYFKKERKQSQGLLGMLQSLN